MPANNWANISEAVIIGTVAGQEYRNVLHFGSDVQINDDSFAVALNQLCDDINGNMISNILNATGATVQFTAIQAKVIWPAPSAAVEVAISVVPNTGRRAGDLLPSFNAQLIKKLTARAGRSFRGRMFLPPPVESDVAGNLITPEQHGRLITVTTDMTGAFIGGNRSSDFQLGVLQRHANGQPFPLAANALHDLIALNPVDLVAVLRRRKQGVGR